MTSLPVVSAAREELARDFDPFRRLAAAPMAMTAHVRYDAVDSQRCASLSPLVVEEVIRGEIGFTGLLMCDDIAMQALEGPLEARMAAALEAGCDIVLHCTGDFAENEALCSAAPPYHRRSGRSPGRGDGMGGRGAAARAGRRRAPG